MFEKKYHLYLTEEERMLEYTKHITKFIIRYLWGVHFRQKAVMFS